MKREVVGIVGISLIAGLWITVLMIGAETTEMVRLVSAEVPERFDRSVGSRPVLSIGLVVDRRLVGLTLRFAVLYEADPAPWVSAAGSWISEEDMDKTSTGVVPLDIWLETASFRGLEISPLRATTRVNGTQYDACVFDFRDIAGDSGAADVFALLFSEGNLTKAYWGHGGFFLDPSTIVASLRIEHGHDSLVYSKTNSKEEKPLSDLPRRGEASFAQVDRDDQILVTMILEGHLIPLESSWLWVCAASQADRGEDVWVLSTM